MEITVTGTYGDWNPRSFKNERSEMFCIKNRSEGSMHG